MPGTPEQDDWIGRVLGVSASAAGGREQPLKQAMRRWSHERELAIASLRGLSRAILGAADPEGARAIVMVQSIIKNLTAAPATRRQVAELVRYLDGDDIIADVERPNPFGISVELKGPLLRALEPMRQLAPD